jgi:cell division protein FtsL
MLVENTNVGPVEPCRAIRQIIQHSKSENLEKILYWTVPILVVMLLISLRMLYAAYSLL